MNVKKFQARIFMPLIGVLILIFLIYWVGYESLLQTFQHITISQIFVISLVYIFSTLLGCFNLYILFSKEVSLNRSKFFFSYWLAWAFGLVIPGGVGDIAVLSGLMKRLNYDWKVSASTAITDKVLTLIWMVAFAGIGGLMISGYGDYSALYAVFFLSSLFVSYQLLIKMDKHWNFTQYRNKNIFLTISVGFLKSILLNKAGVLINFSLTPIKLLLVSCGYLVVFHAVGLQTLDLFSAALGMAMCSLVAYLPVSFNGMGTVEAVAIFVFGALGATSVQVLSAYIILRLVVIFVAWVPVCVFYFLSHIKCAR